MMLYQLSSGLEMLGQDKTGLFRICQVGSG